MPTLIANGTEIHYVEAGVGPTLLLVHGQLCDYRYWQPQRPALAKSYRVIALSLRHFWPDRGDESSATFSSEQHVEDLGAFMAALDVGPIHLCGHSRGGYVALRAAHRFPRAIRTLTLAEPGGPLADPERATVSSLPPALKAELAAVLEQLRAGDIDGGLARFVDAIGGPGAWRRSSEPFRTMARDNALTLLAQARYEPERPLIPYAEATSIGAPVLLVSGERTPPSFLATTETLQRALPKARRVVIPRAGHAMNVENGPAFNRALLEFLDEN